MIRRIAPLFLLVPAVVVAQQQFDFGGEGTFRPAAQTTPAAQGAEDGRVVGTIELIDRAELAASQNGVIQFDVPESGALVSKDQIVAKLDDRVPQANLAVAVAQAASDVDVRSAAAILRVAEKEVASAQQANAAVPNTVTPQEVERLRLTETRSRLDIEKAETEYEIAAARENEAQAVLDTFTIRAPFAGKVRKRYKQRGEAVRQGDTILELVSGDRVSVVARVPFDRVAEFREGQVVQVIPDYGRDRTPMRGTVRLVDRFGEGDAVADKIPLIVEVPDPQGRLFAGFRAEVRP